MLNNQSIMFGFNSQKLFQHLNKYVFNISWIAKCYKVKNLVALCVYGTKQYADMHRS